MIIFHCNRCKMNREVEKIGIFEKCPKCKEDQFFQYYEDNKPSSNTQIMKGGEINMSKKEEAPAKEKKEKTPSKKVLKNQEKELIDSLAKSAIKVINDGTSDVKVKQKVHREMWKVFYNK